MLKLEFIQRTNFFPTEEEFQEIHDLYMSTELDKDSFCRQWKNKNRRYIAWQKRSLRNISRLSDSLRAELRSLESQISFLRQDSRINFIDSLAKRLYDLEERYTLLTKKVRFLDN